MVDTDALHRDALIVDGLVYFSDGDAADLLAGNVNAVNLTVSFFEADFEVAADQVAGWHEEVARPGSPWRLVETAADIPAAQAEGKVGLIMGWQNMRPIADKLERLALFHRLGLRVMQLTYNRRNMLGDGCLEAEDGGLSALGEAAIPMMNDLGIAIDLSHVGERASLRAAELSRKPVLITHGNARALVGSPRNKTDAVIEAVAATGGVIGASIFGPFCWDGDPARHPAVSDFVPHVEHIAGLVGRDKLALGTDLPAVSDWAKVRHITEMTRQRFGAVIEDYASAFGNEPSGRYLADCTSHAQLTAVTAALAERGWSEAELRGFLGENLLRALTEIWGG